jgi:hypothetical protein
MDSGGHHIELLCGVLKVGMSSMYNWLDGFWKITTLNCSSSLTTNKTHTIRKPFSHHQRETAVLHISITHSSPLPSQRFLSFKTQQTTRGCNWSSLLLSLVETHFLTDVWLLMLINCHHLWMSRFKSKSKESNLPWASPSRGNLRKELNKS